MVSIKQNIEQFIANNETAKALNLIVETFKNKDEFLYGKTLILSGQFKEIKSNKDIGILDDKEYRQALAKINNAILNLITDYKGDIVSKVKITNLPDREWTFHNVNADYTADMLQIMNDENRRPYLNLIVGMPGIGKTYLAGKVAYEYSKAEDDRFNIVWFINSESEESILGDLKELAKYLKIDYQGDNEEFIKNIKRYLADSKFTWLIIFDNACDRSTENSNPKYFAEKYFPRTELPKQLIVTSQNLEWNYIFNLKRHLKLKNWSCADYIDFFKSKGIQFTNNSEVELLFNEFGGLPLAASQAISFMKKKNISLRKYISILNTNKEKLLKEKEITIDYKNSVINAILLSYTNLSTESQILISFLAFLAPDNIPVDLICEKIQNCSTTNLSIKNNPFLDILEFENAKSELLIYSLCEQLDSENELLSIHRLIRLSIQNYLISDEKYILYLIEILSILNITFDIDLAEIDTEEYKQFDILLPHLLSVLFYCNTNIDKLHSAINHLALLCFKVGRYYFKLGNDNDALIKFYEAKELNFIYPIYFDELLDNRIDLQIGYLHYLIGSVDTQELCIYRFDKAFQFFKKENLIHEATRCINNIGNIYLNRCDYESAAKWYHEGILISNESFLFHNLGYVYQVLADYDEAIKLYHTSLEISLKENNKYRVAVNYHLLGIVFGLRSEFDKQFNFHLKSLEIFKEIKQTRRITYSLFQLINFSLDIKKTDSISEWYAEHQKYQDNISEDSQYKVDSFLLKCRFSIKQGNVKDIYEYFSIFNTQKEHLLIFNADSIPTNALLDFAKYFFDTADYQNAKIAIATANQFMSKYEYHRRNELDEYISKIETLNV